MFNSLDAILGMKNLNFHFKSKPSIFFFLGIIFILAILFFTGYNLLKQQLTFGSFIFLNTLVFVISYVFAFRFSCGIDLNEKNFELMYYFKDEKPIRLSTRDIISIDKHADTIHRYHKKILITTTQGTHLIRYNISDNSDNDLTELLKLIIERNQKQTSEQQKAG